MSNETPDYQIGDVAPSVRALMDIAGCTGCCTTYLELVEKHAGTLAQHAGSVGERVDYAPALVHRGLSSRGYTDCGRDAKRFALSVVPDTQGITCPDCLKAQLDRGFLARAGDAHYTYEQLQALGLWKELGGWPYDRASAGGETAGRLWGYEHRRRTVQQREITPAAIEAYQRTFGRGEGKWSGNEANERVSFIEAFRHGVSYWAKVEPVGK